MSAFGKVVSISGYADEEKAQYFADIEAQNNLIQILNNDVYKKLDSYQYFAKEIWDQLEKIVLGSKVGNRLRVTTIMDRYENFKMKEEESLDEIVILNNDMKKNKLHRTKFDQNVKFINNLLPEWKPFSRFIKQH